MTSQREQSKHSKPKIRTQNTAELSNCSASEKSAKFRGKDSLDWRMRGWQATELMILYKNKIAIWQGWLAKRKWVDDDYGEREFWWERGESQEEEKGTERHCACCLTACHAPKLISVPG